MVAVAICLVGLTLFSACEPKEDSFIGKWVTSDYHAGDNDTIIFKENFTVELYFDYYTKHEDCIYVIYSLSEDKIIFSTAFSQLPTGVLEYIPVSETFEYVLKGNSLTIKGFSNPFSQTAEIKDDVHFKKIK